MTTLQVRIDETLKRKAKKVADSLGTDLSTAVKIFLVQFTIQKGLPFYVTAEPPFSPAQERKIRKEVDDAIRHGKRYSSVDELFGDILGKDWNSKKPHRRKKHQTR